MGREGEEGEAQHEERKLEVDTSTLGKKKKEANWLVPTAGES